MTKPVFELVEASVARNFWERQEDARIFLHPDVLVPLCERVDWWLGSWGGTPVCLWPICHAFGGGYQPPELASYVGPMWSDAVATNKVHRRWTITHEVFHAFIRMLAERYGTFMFELPPGTRDVRDCQWFGEECASLFSLVIECRHTAIMYAPQVLDDAAISSEFSRNRKRDLRDAQVSGFGEWADPDRSSLFELYAVLLGAKDQGEKAQRREREVATLIELAGSGFGRIIAFRDAAGAPASFTLLLGMRKSALQLLIASSDAARAHGLQAWVQLLALKRSFESGAAVFDFVGGNSRIGAEEKHRYGALPELYFRVSVTAR